MITDIFWDFVTSTLALELLGLVLLAALLVGYSPLGWLLRFVPSLEAYVILARVVAVTVALLMCFLFGFRVSDDREATKNLRETLAVKNEDLEIATKSAADETARAREIEHASDERQKTDAAYIAALKLGAGCGFEPGSSGVRIPARPWSYLSRPSRGP